MLHWMGTAVVDAEIAPSPPASVPRVHLELDDDVAVVVHSLESGWVPLP